MGELLRRFWMPALLSEELPERDGPQKKIRIMGEDLLAFRQTDGRVGIVEPHCPHRGANLYLRAATRSAGLPLFLPRLENSISTGNCCRPADLRRPSPPTRTRSSCWPTRRAKWGDMNLGLHGPARVDARAAAA